MVSIRRLYNKNCMIIRITGFVSKYIHQSLHLLYLQIIIETFIKIILKRKFQTLEVNQIVLIIRSDNRVLVK